MARDMIILLPYHEAHVYDGSFLPGFKIVFGKGMLLCASTGPTSKGDNHIPSARKIMSQRLRLLNEQTMLVEGEACFCAVLLSKARSCLRSPPSELGDLPSAPRNMFWFAVNLRQLNLVSHQPNGIMG